MTGLCRIRDDLLHVARLSFQISLRSLEIVSGGQTCTNKTWLITCKGSAGCQCPSSQSEWNEYEWTHTQWFGSRLLRRGIRSCKKPPTKATHITDKIDFTLPHYRLSPPDLSPSSISSSDKHMVANRPPPQSGESNHAGNSSAGCPITDTFQERPRL